MFVDTSDTLGKKMDFEVAGGDGYGAGYTSLSDSEGLDVSTLVAIPSPLESR